jgi:uncharacterized repeat protein (TIGR01451 family)
MVYVGEDITYELAVANAGPADATGVTLVDTLPVGVTFVSASAGCAEAAGVVTCDIGDLAAGASVEITIVVTAPAEPATLTNSAEVSGEQPDSLVDNNTDSFDTGSRGRKSLLLYLPLIFKPQGLHLINLGYPVPGSPPPSCPSEGGSLSPCRSWDPLFANRIE